MRSTPVPTGAGLGAFLWGAGVGAVGSASAGSYLNYLEPGRPMRDYYGSSWTQLVKTARRYDPAGVLASPFTLPA